MSTTLPTPAMPRGTRAVEYLPIADHGVIGDLRSVALVGTDGTIDWYCCPRFDAPSVFGAILDSEKGGQYRIAPVGECSTKQLYFPDTNVLITRFLAPAGVSEVQDFMPVPDCADTPQRLVRRVGCVRGQMRFRLDCDPRFNYGRDAHEVTIAPGAAHFRSADLSLRLSAPVPLHASATGAYCEFVLQAGQTVSFVLEEQSEAVAPLAEAQADALFEQTVEYWLDWISQSTYTGRWREMVSRSALTLKLLTYEPTGAIVAAATASLPEQLGGARNWDYRYAFVRDAALTLHALLGIGFRDEAAAFAGFLGQRFRGASLSGGDPLQVLYGIDGRTDVPEEILGHLEGYGGAAPVRIGNEAARQLQLDIYGESIDAAYLIERHGGQMPYDAWCDLVAIVEWLSEHWDQPDEGIWETRGGRKRFTHSRVMSWVAFDRVVRIAQERGLPGDIARWMATRDEIFRRIMERSWSERRYAFVQFEGAEVLDASVLLMPLVGFIAPTDPRWLSTLDAISSELVSDSLVYRYDPEASPDGLDGDEGTFSICSFWYVEALTQAGRIHDARLAFEKMLTYANHVGLYSEEIGASGELLGNFPQAFTHLALINAAVRLDRQLG